MSAAKPFFICPFHGKVEATAAQIKRDGKNVDGFKCPAEKCPIERLKNELEFPA